MFKSYLNYLQTGGEKNEYDITEEDIKSFKNDFLDANFSKISLADLINDNFITNTDRNTHFDDFNLSIGKQIEGKTPPQDNVCTINNIQNIISNDINKITMEKKAVDRYDITNTTTMIYFINNKSSMKINTYTLANLFNSDTYTKIVPLPYGTFNISTEEYIAGTDISDNKYNLLKYTMNLYDILFFVSWGLYNKPELNKALTEINKLKGLADFANLVNDFKYIYLNNTSILTKDFNTNNTQKLKDIITKCNDIIDIQNKHIYIKCTKSALNSDVDKFGNKYLVNSNYATPLTDGNYLDVQAILTDIYNILNTDYDYKKQINTLFNEIFNSLKDYCKLYLPLCEKMQASKSKVTINEIINYYKILEVVNVLRIKGVDENNIINICETYNDFVTNDSIQNHIKRIIAFLVITYCINSPKTSGGRKSKYYGGGLTIEKLKEQIQKFIANPKSITVETFTNIVNEINASGKNGEVTKLFTKLNNILINKGLIQSDNKLPGTNQITDWAFLDKVKYVMDDNVSIIPLKAAFGYMNNNTNKTLLNYGIMQKLESGILSAFGMDILKVNIEKDIYTNPAYNKKFDDYLYNVIDTAEAEHVKSDELLNHTGETSLDNLQYNIDNKIKVGVITETIYNKICNIVKSTLSFRDKINLICKNMYNFKNTLDKVYFYNFKYYTFSYDDLTITDIRKQLDSQIDNFELNGINGKQYFKNIIAAATAGTHLIGIDKSNMDQNTNIQNIPDDNPDLIKLITHFIELVTSANNKMRYCFLNFIYMIVNFEALLVFDLILHKPYYAAQILPILLDNKNYNKHEDFIKAVYIIRHLLYNSKFDLTPADNKYLADKNNMKSYIDKDNRETLNKAFNDGINKYSNVSNLVNELKEYEENITVYNKFEFNIKLPEAIPKVLKDTSSVSELSIDLLNPHYNTGNIQTKSVVLGGDEDQLLQEQHLNVLKDYNDNLKDDDMRNVQIWGTQLVLNCILNTSLNEECGNVIANIGLKDFIISFLRNMKKETKIKILWSLGVKFNKSGNKYLVESYESYKKRNNINDSPTKKETKETKGGLRFYEGVYENSNEQRRLLKYYIIHMLIDSVMYNEYGKPQNYQDAYNNLSNEQQTSKSKPSLLNIFDKLNERSKDVMQVIDTKKKPSHVDFDAWLAYSNRADRVGGNTIEGGGFYTDTFKAYYEHYKNNLERLGYKMSAKDKYAFEDALNKLEGAEDSLTHYFAQYKYVVEHYKDIKDKLSGQNITEQSLETLKKQLSDAAADKQQKQDTLIKMIQQMNQYDKIPGISVNFEFIDDKK